MKKLKKKDRLLQIAIDGPACSGKTTIASKLAKFYKINHLSTGNIFRCFALCVKNIDYSDQKKVKKTIKKINLTINNGNFYLDDKNVSPCLNDEKIANIASLISQQKYVRKKYGKITKNLIKNKSFVLDGRDIGTIILPKTKYKFYLDASLDVRAWRRLKQLKKKQALIKEITNDLRQRDYKDQNRQLSALKVAKDATIVNTDNKTIDKTINFIKKVIQSKK